jgi:WhiB family transcriptional regulator, redox-sensing transcriptional regulator
VTVSAADFSAFAPATATWQQDAACRDADPDLFFGNDERTRQAALSYCTNCPVRIECLEQALASRETYGIWGGTDEHERKRLLRQRRRAA